MVESFMPATEEEIHAAIVRKYKKTAATKRKKELVAIGIESIIFFGTHTKNQNFIAYGTLTTVNKLFPNTWVIFVKLGKKGRRKKFVVSNRRARYQTVMLKYRTLVSIYGYTKVVNRGEYNERLLMVESIGELHSVPSYFDVAKREQNLDDKLWHKRQTKKGAEEMNDLTKFLELMQQDDSDVSDSSESSDDIADDDD